MLTSDARKEFTSLLDDPIANIDRLCEIIKIIGVDGSDDEAAHSMEDSLRAAYLTTLTDPVAHKILALKKLDFSRWCA